MLFTSGLFLFLFLPITLAGFFVVARFGGAAAGIAWLAAASLTFYGYWVPQFLILLLGSIALNFCGGLVIAGAGSRRRAWNWAALFIAADLLILGYYKYYNFFAESLGAIGIAWPALSVVLPIGISFFTFTQIAYLVDAYHGKVREHRPLSYLLFVTYFPHLIAGPILHHAEMMPQFADRATYRPRLRNIGLGLGFLVIGLAKKVLVADSISDMADAAFNAAAGGAIGPAHAWEGAIAYALQIYFDFSGYSDMAVGISLLFGIRLPFNFDSPYQSTSIVDFWRRWHMTLSRFLRDYLYIALGGNRRGKARRYVNLFVTMVLGGLWHGAAWTFVIWGALHGVYLIINHVWNWAAARLGVGPDSGGRGGRIIGWGLTMLAVVVAWVFFRATSVDEAMHMLGAMAGRQPSQDVLAATSSHWLVLVPLAAAAALLPNSQRIVDGPLAAALDRSLARRGDGAMIAIGGALIVVIWLAMVAASRTNSAFIYFNF